MQHSDTTGVDTRAPEPHRIDNGEESRNNVVGLAIDYDRSDFICGLLSCGGQVLCAPSVNHTPDHLEL